MELVRPGDGDTCALCVKWADVVLTVTGSVQFLLCTACCVDAMKADDRGKLSFRGERVLQAGLEPTPDFILETYRP